MADVITTVVDLGTPINVTVEANGAEWIAEENRRDNEKSRVQAETVRTENENIRKQAENQRIQNENLRKSTVETIEREYAPRLNAVESGSPKGVFGSLALLQADTKANTTEGKKYTYITLDNGNWNYWDSSTSTWKAGGLYQSVKGEAYNININDADNNFDADNVEDALKEVAIKNQASNALIGKASGKLLNIYTALAKARKLDILSNTIATPTDPSKPISPDNPAILESVGEGNLFGEEANKKYPAFLPAGSKLSYSRGTNSTNGLIYLYNAQGIEDDSFNLAIGNYSRTITVKRDTYYIAHNADFGSNPFACYGDVAQPYVPYGCTKVHVCGKNLIDFSDRYVSDESSASTITRVSGNTEYTISYNLKRNDAITPNQKSYQGWYKILDIQGNIISQNRITYANYDTIGNSIVNVTRTLTMPSNACYLVVIFSAYYSNTVTNTWYISSAQLELGAPTPYSPYNGTEYTVPLKDTQGNIIPFRGLETSKSRVFKDLDGLYKVRKNVEKRILNGTESWAHNGEATDTIEVITSSITDKMYGTLNIIADKFKTALSSTDMYICGRATSANVSLRFLKSHITNWSDAWTTTEKVNAIKTWLASNPITVYYQLATPTTITLHQDAQTALNKIEQMLDGQTVIYGTDKVAPSFEVEYVEDANKVIGNLKDEITKLKLALINLGGNV